MTECLYSFRKNFRNKDSGANPGEGHSDRFKYGIFQAISLLICLAYSKGVSLCP